MSSQSDAEQSDPYEQIKRIIAMSQASVHDQLAAFREELNSATVDIGQFKTQTEGAVDASFRLTAEVENNLAAISGSLTRIENDTKRQKYYTIGITALTTLNTWAIMTISYSGLDEFTNLRQRYFNIAMRMHGLITEFATCDAQDLPNIAGQFAEALTDLNYLIGKTPTPPSLARTRNLKA
ncbi:MAG: hypothetical protein OXH22_11390 [Chloroflexi bacterium]|nr:hypothetical protein [Chloroflexota bacterium]